MLASNYPLVHKAHWGWGEARALGRNKTSDLFHRSAACLSGKERRPSASASLSPPVSASRSTCRRVSWTTSACAGCSARGTATRPAEAASAGARPAGEPLAPHQRAHRPLRQPRRRSAPQRRSRRECTRPHGSPCEAPALTPTSLLRDAHAGVLPAGCRYCPEVQPGNHRH